VKGSKCEIVEVDEGVLQEEGEKRMKRKDKRENVLR